MFDKKKDNSPFLELEDRQKMFAHIRLVGTDVLICSDVPKLHENGVYKSEYEQQKEIERVKSVGGMLLAISETDNFLPKDIIGKRVKITYNSKEEIKYSEEGIFKYHAVVIPSYLVSIIIDEERRCEPNAFDHLLIEKQPEVKK